MSRHDWDDYSVGEKLVLFFLLLAIMPAYLVIDIVRRK